jgi:hypothetical protein
MGPPYRIFTLQISIRVCSFPSVKVHFPVPRLFGVSQVQTFSLALRTEFMTHDALINTPDTSWQYVEVIFQLPQSAKPCFTAVYKDCFKHILSIYM